MRQIVLDTETTGLDPASGHRIIEIGCVELIDRLPTGQVFHTYLNPQREIPFEATAIHGITNAQVLDKPLFEQIADEMLAFLADSPLIIHNAGFDLKFLNAELSSVGKPSIAFERAIDTVLIARKKFPGAPASLDALCKRFEIDLSDRTKHGALLDSQLLAQVYLELMGGRQATLALNSDAQAAATIGDINEEIVIVRRQVQARHFPVAPEELQAHQAMLSQLKSPLWLSA